MKIQTSKNAYQTDPCDSTNYLNKNTISQDSPHVNIRKLLNNSLQNTRDQSCLSNNQFMKSNLYLETKCQGKSFKRSLLKKRESFQTDKAFILNSKPSSKVLNFDPNFEKNQKNILKYISNLSSYRRKIILQNTLRLFINKKQKKTKSYFIKSCLKKNVLVYKEDSTFNPYTQKMKFNNSTLNTQTIITETTSENFSHDCSNKDLDLKKMIKVLVKIKKKKIYKKNYFDYVHTKLQNFLLNQGKAKLSNPKKLLNFLNLFFCQRSTRESYETLFNIEKFFVFLIIVNKRFTNFSCKCLCFEYVKHLETCSTEVEDDQLIHFYLKKTIQVLC